MQAKSVLVPQGKAGHPGAAGKKQGAAERDPHAPTTTAALSGTWPSGLGGI